MNNVKLKNIPTLVSEKEITDLLFELHCLYHEGTSAAKAYNDMAKTVKNGKYSNTHMAQLILDGAHEAREAEVAHIRDRMFILLRDFFEPLEHDLSE